MCLLYAFSVNFCLDLIMLKPNASNKVKNTDDQVFRANAKASSLDTSEKIEMYESILQVVNTHLDAFELNFQKLVTSQAELQDRVANQNSS